MASKVESADAMASFSEQRLTDWLDAQKIGNGPVEKLQRLSGGTQNILIRFERGGVAYVIRRGPLHLRAESNRTMMREARLLEAFARTSLPHPRFVTSCEDVSVAGASFYVMRAVDGFNATLNPSRRMQSDPAFRRQMGRSLISALGKLAELDPIALGLGDFGKLDGFLERQTPRWASQLKSYEQFEQWTGRADLAGFDEIGAWLSRNLPAGFKPGIIHGDYHIGNVIYQDSGDVAAIVDWEMATLGDPLVDLGRVLSTWPDDDGFQPISMPVKPWDGFPSRDELIALYHEVTGRDLAPLRWFEILSCYKLAAILEGTYARAQAGLADLSTGEQLHKSAVALVGRALRRRAD